MEEEKKETVVLYPGVGVGHQAPMLELASALLRHGGGGDAFHVAVALVEPPVTDPGFLAAVARAKATHTSVAFHVLPPPPPPVDDGSGSGAGGELDMATRLRFLRAMNAPLRDFLRSLPVRALVLDMFCGDALDVAAELGLPAYFFFASGGTGLAVFLGLPALRASLGDAGFAALDGDAVLSSFPGAPPFRVPDLPADMIAGDGDGEACAAMLRMASRMLEARGILVNTFASLEPRAVRALRDGLCGGGATPPVYCVGPLVSPGGEDHGCLRWLDAQPDRSVVFLCFGSLGAFSATQLREIAVGLERSGQRFLWVVRLPRNGAANLSGGDISADDDLAGVLPAGFLDRTKDRGLVVASWAPQAAVLRHRAAGAFVTHCGWNSALEGVAAGLPLLCWPLYAEQRLNKVWLVHEMRLGVEMMVKTKTTRRSCVDGGDEEEEEEDVVVSAAEVEEKVRWVMESDDDGARALRERVAAARDAAADALADGGSSRADFVQFIRDLENSERVHG